MYRNKDEMINQLVSLKVSDNFIKQLIDYIETGKEITNEELRCIILNDLLTFFVMTLEHPNFGEELFKKWANVTSTIQTNIPEAAFGSFEKYQDYMEHAKARMYFYYEHKTKGLELLVSEYLTEFVTKDFELSTEYNNEGWHMDLQIGKMTRNEDGSLVKSQELEDVKDMYKYMEAQEDLRIFEDGTISVNPKEIEVL